MTAKWRPAGYENPFLSGGVPPKMKGVGWNAYEAGWDAAVEALRKQSVGEIDSKGWVKLGLSYHGTPGKLCFIPDETPFAIIMQQ